MVTKEKEWDFPVWINVRLNIKVKPLGMVDGLNKSELVWHLYRWPQ